MVITESMKKQPTEGINLLANFPGIIHKYLCFITKLKMKKKTQINNITNNTKKPTNKQTKTTVVKAV